MPIFIKKGSGGSSSSPAQPTGPEILPDTLYPIPDQVGIGLPEEEE